MSEHLAAWKGGRGQLEDEEKDGEGGDEGDGVDGEADHVLAHAEHYEVLWGVRCQQEEEGRECKEMTGQHEKKGCLECWRPERVLGEAEQ